MLKFVELSEKDLEKCTLPGQSFLQSAEMYRRYQKLGREAYILGVIEGPEDYKKTKKSEILAIMLVFSRPWRFGQKIFRAPGGPVALYDSPKIAEILKVLTSGAQSFCRKRGGMVLEISPNLVLHPRDFENDIVPDGFVSDPKKIARGGKQNPQKADPRLWVTTRARNHENIVKILQKQRYKNLGEQEQTKWQYVLELERKTEEELLMAMRQVRRQEIKKAENSKLQIREISESTEIKKFYQLMLDTAKRQNFQAPELEYFISVKNEFGDKAKIVVVDGPEEMVQTTASGQPKESGKKPKNAKLVPYATMLFIAFGDEIVYLYSGADEKYLGTGVVTAVQWQMIKYARENKYKRYNMYGVKPVEGNGVFRSKQAFGGHVEELLGTFTKPLNIAGRIYLLTKKYQEFGDIH